MKAGAFRATAVALFDGPGDGVPRYREGIIAAIERALEQAHANGRQGAWPEARQLALSEAKAALSAAAQSLTARVSEVDRALKPPCSCDTIPCSCPHRGARAA